MNQYLIEEDREELTWRHFLNEKELQTIEDAEMFLYSYKDYRSRMPKEYNWQDRWAGWLQGNASQCMVRCKQMLRRAKGARRKAKKAANTDRGYKTTLIIECEDGVDPVEFWNSLGGTIALSATLIKRNENESESMLVRRSSSPR